eukprot:805639-Pelagomonas_calceolata.AAC.2
MRQKAGRLSLSSYHHTQLLCGPAPLNCSFPPPPACMPQQDRMQRQRAVLALSVPQHTRLIRPHCFTHNFIHTPCSATHATAGGLTQAASAPGPPHR